MKKIVAVLAVAFLIGISVPIEAETINEREKEILTPIADVRAKSTGYGDILVAQFMLENEGSAPGELWMYVYDETEDTVFCDIEHQIVDPNRPVGAIKIYWEGGDEYHSWSYEAGHYDNYGNKVVDVTGTEVYYP